MGTFCPPVQSNSLALTRPKFSVVPSESDARLLEGIARMPSHQTGSSRLGRLLTDVVDLLALGRVPHPDGARGFLAVPLARGGNQNGRLAFARGGEGHRFDR